MDTLKTKVCTRCGVEKSVDDFYIKDAVTGRRHAQCKSCYNLARAERNERLRAARPIRPTPPPATERACTSCGVVFPIDEFPIKNSATGQRRSVCHACKLKQQEAYRAANREQLRQRGSIYYAANKDALRERQAAWRAANPEQAKEIVRKSKAKHAEQRRAYNNKYQRENAPNYRAYYNNRRARIKGNGGTYTPQEWEALKAEYDYTCLLCGRREPDIKLTPDHVVPIALGGPNTIDNLQPLCGHCNSRKSKHIIDLRKRKE